jgi:hypothetical protein
MKLPHAMLSGTVWFKKNSFPDVTENKGMYLVWKSEDSNIFTGYGCVKHKYMMQKSLTYTMVHWGTQWCSG